MRHRDDCSTEGTASNYQGVVPRAFQGTSDGEQTVERVNCRCRRQRSATPRTVAVFGYCPRGLAVARILGDGPGTAFLRTTRAAEAGSGREADKGREERITVPASNGRPILLDPWSPHAGRLLSETQVDWVSITGTIGRMRRSEVSAAGTAAGTALVGLAGSSATGAGGETAGPNGATSGSFSARGVGIVSAWSADSVGGLTGRRLRTSPFPCGST